MTVQDKNESDMKWRGLYRVGAATAILQLALIPVAMVVFLTAPPPETTAELFALFHKSPVQGLLALDLVYMVTIALVGVLLLALCIALRKSTPTLSLLAATLGLLSTAMYFPSNVAFEMLRLSQEYAAASTDAQRTALLGAGEAMLAIYQGTTFNVSYVMAAVAGLLVAAAMFKSHVFGRVTASLGLVANLLGLIPSSAGMIGMIAAIAFLFPYVIWLPLVARRLVHLSNGAPVVLPPRSARGVTPTTTTTRTRSSVTA